MSSRESHFNVLLSELISSLIIISEYYNFRMKITNVFFREKETLMTGGCLDVAL